MFVVSNKHNINNDYVTILAKVGVRVGTGVGSGVGYAVVGCIVGCIESKWTIICTKYFINWFQCYSVVWIL